MRMSLSALKNAATAAAVAGAVLAAAPAVDASVFHFRAPRPANIGVRSERYLDNCPPTPNCVSSMANVVRCAALARALRGVGADFVRTCVV